jgi:hypothetical protein
MLSGICPAKKSAKEVSQPNFQLVVAYNKVLAHDK